MMPNESHIVATQDEHGKQWHFTPNERKKRVLMGAVGSDCFSVAFYFILSVTHREKHVYIVTLRIKCCAIKENIKKQAFAEIV